MGKFDTIDSVKVRQMALFPELDVSKVVWKKKCRTCAWRKRFSLNEHSNKVVQCCTLQPSKRSNSGYKTIKVTDIACIAYKEKE